MGLNGATHLVADWSEAPPLGPPGWPMAWRRGLPLVGGCRLTEAHGDVIKRIDRSIKSRSRPIKGHHRRPLTQCPNGVALFHSVSSIALMPFVVEKRESSAVNPLKLWRLHQKARSAALCLFGNHDRTFFSKATFFPALLTLLRLDGFIEMVVDNDSFKWLWTVLEIDQSLGPHFNSVMASILFWRSAQQRRWAQLHNLITG